MDAEAEFLDGCRPGAVEQLARVVEQLAARRELDLFHPVRQQLVSRMITLRSPERPGRSFAR
ncbi:hypothetical protein [Streptomyces sp. NPDC050355]|uniref:hypothetical protein n=1 Tax=Streptomyces sp. NPDC050355 TaxID=3365609 RepID=UPI00379D7556